MKTIKYIGLDVHKNSISIATAMQERDAEVRYYGKISNDMDQLMKVFRKFISQGYKTWSVSYYPCRKLPRKCRKVPSKNFQHEYIADQ